MSLNPEFISLIERARQEFKAGKKLSLEAIAADEALWDAQFASTDDDKLAALVALVDAEISEGGTLQMFDKRGEFVEHK